MHSLTHAIMQSLTDGQTRMQRASGTDGDGGTKTRKEFDFSFKMVITLPHIFIFK